LLKFKSKIEKKKSKITTTTLTMTKFSMGIIITMFLKEPMTKSLARHPLMMITSYRWITTMALLNPKPKTTKAIVDLVQSW
jgi:hypothetical protein